MDKHAEIREDTTPPETDDGDKVAEDRAESLVAHATTRLSEQARLMFEKSSIRLLRKA